MRIEVEFYYCALSNGYFFQWNMVCLLLVMKTDCLSVCGIVGMIIMRDLSTGVQNTAEIIIKTR